MSTMNAYHHNFSSAGTYTIELHEKPRTILVKNMTNNKIKLSWGDSINNNDYVEMLKETAELVPYFEMSENDLNLTIQATGTGDVEVRIVEY